MKIRQVEAELFHTDGQTNKNDDANSRLSHFCESAYKSVPPPEIERWSPVP
jgi:hypothetical protein